MARKKCGNYRLCIDFRKLNERMKGDPYPIPRPEVLLQSCAGDGWFTLLDLKKGYHQILVTRDAREKLAFVCHLGTYVYLKMPYGMPDTHGYGRHHSEIFR